MNLYKMKTMHTNCLKEIGLYFKSLWHWFKILLNFLDLFLIALIFHQGVRIISLVYLNQNTQHIIDNISSLLFQCFGGAYIIYLISKDLKLFDEKDFKESILNWLKAFPIPCKRKSMQLKGKLPTLNNLKASLKEDIKITEDISSLSTDEKIASIHTDIKNIASYILKMEEIFPNKWQEDLNELKGKINQALNKSNDQINKIKESNISPKNIKHKINAFLIVSYGIGISIFYI
jgi:ElaB/YqjD/DUF883 family membrane-anchored ribosome-binding protein